MFFSIYTNWCSVLFLLSLLNELIFSPVFYIVLKYESICYPVYYWSFSPSIFYGQEDQWFPCCVLGQFFNLQLSFFVPILSSTLRFYIYLFIFLCYVFLYRHELFVLFYYFPIFCLFNTFKACHQNLIIEYMEYVQPFGRIQYSITGWKNIQCTVASASIVTGPVFLPRYSNQICFIGDSV